MGRELLGTAAPVTDYRDTIELGVERLKSLRRFAAGTRYAGLGTFSCGLAVGAFLAGAVSAYTRPPQPTSVPAARWVVVRPAPVIPSPSVNTSSAPPPLAPSADPGPGPRGTAGSTVPSPNRPRSRSAALSGTLVVRSKPEGASVFVNNALAGRTPLVLRSLPVGSRAVGVRLDGYVPWSRGVRVTANQSTSVVAELTRSRTAN